MNDPVRPWHESFFSGLWQRVQPQAFSPEQSREDAEGLLELLQLMPGQRVLDVPCGDGRIAIELASRGLVPTGVDRSAEFLALAREKAAARQVVIDWREGDMWKLDLPREFDAAICMWGSLGYWTDEEDLALFRGLASALKPGGSLVIDTHVLETLLPEFSDRGWFRAGDMLVLEERRFDHAASRVEVDWTLVGDAERETVHSSLRMYSFFELCKLLQEVGFAEFTGYGSLELEPFELGASRLVLHARLPE